MRPFILCLCLCVIVIYAWTPSVEARSVRSAGGCSSCVGDTCALAKAPAKDWQWSKPTPPVVTAPIVVDVVAPCAAVDEPQGVEGRKPLRHILAGVAHVASRVGKALTSTVRIGRAIVGHERRSERRVARRGGE
jgi:hypothetical protein